MIFHIPMKVYFFSLLVRKVECMLQMKKSVMFFRPKLIVAGASAYARVYDYVRMRKATIPEYKAYQEQVLASCKKFSQSLIERGYDLVFGETYNHLVLVNLGNKGIDGSRVEKVLESVHIVADKYYCSR
ncbi:putative glycine hydroxymethyltransferase [Helianthus debilis subsp. tardiflorus]